MSDARHIEADIPTMVEIAARMAGAVERDYAPHAVAVSDTLLTRLPSDRLFTELDLFVHALERAQEITLQNVHDYANGTHGLAEAAREAGAGYAESDQRAARRAADLP